MQYYLIGVGCAECRFGLDDPLISAEGPFDTIEAAKAVCNVGETFWRTHPLGGLFYPTGQGDIWIMPIQKFEIKDGINVN